MCLLLQLARLIAMAAVHRFDNLQQITDLARQNIGVCAVECTNRNEPGPSAERSSTGGERFEQPLRIVESARQTRTKP
jgi:hypothetical protein